MCAYKTVGRRYFFETINFMNKNTQNLINIYSNIHI